MLSLDAGHMIVCNADVIRISVGTILIVCNYAGHCKKNFSMSASVT